MQKKIIIKKLENNVTHFTELDKCCADFFKNYEKISELKTLKDISKIIHVSEASISRYLKKIGFNSFSHFQFWINEINNSSIYHDSLLVDIKRTLSSLEKTDMKEIAKSLNSYDKIYIVGRSSSKQLGVSFSKKLAKLGMPTKFFYIDDFDEIDRRTKFHNLGAYKTGLKVAWVIVSISGESIPFYLNGDFNHIFEECDLISLTSQKPSEKYFKYFKYMLYAKPFINFEEQERYLPRNSEVLMSVLMNYIVKKIIELY